MKTNWEIELRGLRIALVPYRRKFVDKYHLWMQDPYILEMTASEPLSLEEEYAMQVSWRDDDKKCTFIIISIEGEDGDKNKAEIESETYDYDYYISRMAGDVNLFFNDLDDSKVCEIEIMIAEERFRRQGYASEALRMMMAYGVKELGVRRFYCKIHKTNEASIALFRKLGYSECNFVEAFGEFEYEMIVSETETGTVVDTPLSVNAKAGAEHVTVRTIPFTLAEST